MYQKQHFDFKAHGAFFAFSSDQFNEQKVEGQEYVHTGAGLICPKSKAKEIMELCNQFYANEVKKAIEADGLDAIIAYELNNHECYYTGELDDVQFLVDEYGATREQIRKIYSENLAKQDL